MKRMKKFFLLMMVVVMACVCSLGLTGCVEDIKKLEINLQICDYDNGGEMEEYTLSIDLYRHLAPKTVDAISGYVKEGYYDGALFYKMTSFDSQYMVGDLLYDAESTETQNIVKNAVKPNLPGEFEYGGTVGSNLTNRKGSIGLWRSWYAVDGGYQDNRNATDSGSATWFLPSTLITSYNKYFCVFGQFDVNDDDNKATLEALASVFEEENCENFVIYYTGEYDNLQYHCVPESDFRSNEIDDLFVAEGEELTCYNHFTISIPVTPLGAMGAKIVSAKIV